MNSNFGADRLRQQQQQMLHQQQQQQQLREQQERMRREQQRQQEERDQQRRRDDMTRALKESMRIAKAAADQAKERRVQQAAAGQALRPPTRPPLPGAQPYRPQFLRSQPSASQSSTPKPPGARDFPQTAPQYPHYFRPHHWWQFWR
ncbi:hypothetical protein ACFQ6N_07325 [Kitasatospora sp. NPDC056446]|uniref:hypothetical protein n=1 Tax=Kitasatospora sp. NPDC056446 TaxID=3345819 RepID=UPI003696E395